MNVKEIGGYTNHYHLFVYVGCTLVLTLITTWVIIAMQDESIFHSGEQDRFGIRRILWPIFYSYKLLKKMVNAVQGWCRRRGGRV